MLGLAGVDDNVYGQEIRQQAAALGVREGVVFTAPYRKPEAFARSPRFRSSPFPRQGFGLPVIEAMSQGKPVFLSRAQAACLKWRR